MARLVFASILFFLTAQAPAHADPLPGTLTNFALTYKFGTSAGTDQFDITANYALGSGNNGLGLPGSAVNLSFDGGRFTQSFPTGSFTSISGGFRFQAATGASGITLFKIMNDGTITLQARKLDLTGMKPSAMLNFSFTVGDDSFSIAPNSVPVARIYAPFAGTAGQLVTLDGSGSTDFNFSQNLSYSWAIVSQPLGSNVSLSSASNATTSFIPSHNGSYVVRLTPNDGLIDGTPAVVSVEVSGAGDPPPPPPSPENGLITLSASQPSYIVGETATLNLREDAQPGNGTTRWYFKATLQDQPITLTPVPNSTLNTYTTSAFTAAGTQVFKVDLYIENINMAKGLQKTIEVMNADIAAIDAALLHETNPEVISQLQAKRALDLEQIVNAQQQLEDNRTKVGDTAVLAFDVCVHRNQRPPTSKQGGRWNDH